RNVTTSVIPIGRLTLGELCSCRQFVMNRSQFSTTRWIPLSMGVICNIGTRASSRRAGCYRLVTQYWHLPMPFVILCHMKGTDGTAAHEVFNRGRGRTAFRTSRDSIEY